MLRTPRTTCLLTLTLTALAMKVQSQSICIPEARGVPNLNGQPMNGPPNWRGGPTMMLTRFDDPRWRGAVSQSHNGEVEFRALHKTGSPDTLFLSWRALIDGSLDQPPTSIGTSPTYGDQLVVGIKQPNDKSIIIRLGFGPNPSDNEEAGSVRYGVYEWDSVNPLTSAGSPPWINSAAAWTWLDAQSGNRSWSFQIAIPISTGGINSGVNIPTSFQMFYAFLVQMATTYPESDWPDLPPIKDNFNQVTYPDTTLPWGSFSWGGSSTSCAGDVALDPLQIGRGDVTGNIVDYQVQFDLPPGPNSVQNLITARPQNISGVSIPANRIQADFFLSNYGSQVPIASFWQKISPVAPTSPLNTTDMSTSGSFGVIQFPWIVPVTPADQRCWYITDPSFVPAICPSAGISDQCILVQLSVVPATPPPAPIVFKNQSTYMNMLFKKASTLRHRAQISVVGLQPLADGRFTRDVYLYVETVNMSARTSLDALGKSAVTATRDTMIVAHQDTALRTPWGIIRLGRGDSLRIPIKRTLLAAGASPGQRFAAVREAAAAGKLSVAQVDSQVPTYRIHAYHATGDSLGKLPILEAQTSFGYWVEHDGEIMGWRHHIEGEHLVRLAPNYYKIEVPNSGRSIITTVIEPIAWKPFALSLHAGIGIPSGNFKNTNDPGLALTADAEYWLSRSVGVEGLFGYHRFGGTSGNPDLELFHASGGLELRITTGTPSIIVEGGGGFYNFKPGSGDPGVHGGVGLEFDVSPYVSLGASGRIHSVSTSGSKTTFYSVQGGARIRL